jgi:hypothetical protein
VSVADTANRERVGEGEDPWLVPGDDAAVFAAAPKCAPRAQKAGEIPVDPAFDVVRARVGGGEPTRLTQTPGFDGEPAVCGKDGSIVFSSMRDGDVDLYRMDRDGGHVQRLTATAGYDGGATFDADCTHVAWHATRPKGRELEEYRAQLGEGLLRPSSIELWAANADGTDARQITYLDARSWGPTWYPGERRVVFASTFGGETARDVDLWAIDVDGTNLERVTTSPGVDAWPSFSADGQWLAFASARATPLGKRDENAFAARWVGAWRHVEERPADHLMGDSAWLADRAREGRGLGSKGLDDAGAYVERSFRAFGMQPGGDEEFRQPFDVAVKIDATTALEIAGVPVPASSVRAFGFSGSVEASAPLVYVGQEDDYGRVDVRSKIVIARAGLSPRHAAANALRHGASGIVLVTDGTPAEPSPDASEGIAAVAVSRAAVAGVLASVVRGQRPNAHLAVTLAPETAHAFNVVARWPASVPADQRLPGVVVVGAHYDGVGEGSPGADANASGTAALLQVARSLGEKKPALRRDLLLVGFSGEERGAAGARAFVRRPPRGVAAKDVLAMIDLDMVGRMRDDTLQVFGSDTAPEWTDLLRGACHAAHVECQRATGGGLGGADRSPFFEAGVPNVHLFTGVHVDHGKVGDVPAALNATGMAQVARIAEHLARDVSDLGSRLAFARDATPPGEGETRSYGASLGTIPDRSSDARGVKGMLLAGVRPGGPADKAGLRKGDLVVRLGRHVVAGVEDVMFVLTQSKAGAVVEAVVVRDGKEITASVTLDAPGGR